MFASSNFNPNIMTGHSVEKLWRRCADLVAKTILVNFTSYVFQVWYFQHRQDLWYPWAININEPFLMLRWSTCSVICFSSITLYSRRMVHIALSFLDLILCWTNRLNRKLLSFFFFFFCNLCYLHRYLLEINMAPSAATTTVRLNKHFELPDIPSEGSGFDSERNCTPGGECHVLDDSKLIVLN